QALKAVVSSQWPVASSQLKAGILLAAGTHKGRAPRPAPPKKTNLPGIYRKQKTENLLLHGAFVL
ncbi:MAG TPA: hypothetical protein VIN67_04895, partial [Desulfobaccales bacterium]